MFEFKAPLPIPVLENEDVNDAKDPCPKAVLSVPEVNGNQRFHNQPTSSGNSSKRNQFTAVRELCV